VTSGAAPVDRSRPTVVGRIRVGAAAGRNLRNPRAPGDPQVGVPTAEEDPAAVVAPRHRNRRRADHFGCPMRYAPGRTMRRRARYPGRTG